MSIGPFRIGQKLLARLDLPVVGIAVATLLTCGIIYLRSIQILDETTREALMRAEQEAALQTQVLGQNVERILDQIDILHSLARLVGDARRVGDQEMERRGLRELARWGVKKIMASARSERFRGPVTWNGPTCPIARTKPIWVSRRIFSRSHGISRRTSLARPCGDWFRGRPTSLFRRGTTRLMAHSKT